MYMLIKWAGLQANLLTHERRGSLLLPRQIHHQTGAVTLSKRSYFLLTKYSLFACDRLLKCMQANTYVLILLSQFPVNSDSFFFLSDTFRFWLDPCLCPSLSAVPPSDVDQINQNRSDRRHAIWKFTEAKLL